MNGLEIPVCKNANSYLGSKIDGKIGNEIIILSARAKSETKSQSGKKANLHFKNAKDVKTDLPIQVTFTKTDGVKIFAPYVPDGKAPPTGETVSVSGKSYIDIWLKYVAKTFLSAGYYTYGNIFREKVDTKPLRLIVNHSHDELRTNYLNELSSVDAHYIFQEDPSGFIKMCRAICQSVGDASCIALVPDKDGLTCFAGILGHYIGLIRVSADTSNFPVTGEHVLGHFICVQNKKLVRVPFRRVLEKMQSEIDKADIQGAKK